MFRFAATKSGWLQPVKAMLMLRLYIEGQPGSDPVA
jgi:hypothetical protein